MSERNFFSELKRRNVVRMAGLYLVGAWLLVQVAGTVLPMFGAPDWLPRSIVILLAIGFIPALIFSWVFELTPQGLKRDEDVRPEQSIAPQTARRMNHMIIAVLVFALGYFAVDKFVLAPRRAVMPNDTSSAIGAKSIAVLPFENLSDDKANAYFAEGVQDEILTRLAKVADLKVISRTSTQHFKSSPDNLPQIAKQLGVINILEGSVQKSNDQVRVNVQLINALTDAHLWADIYDRKLTDLFAVESDIAKTIADTLQAKLTGSEKISIAKTPTANPEAYELYLKGRFFWNKRTAAHLRKSTEYFDQAIEKDPNYALAYAALAQAWLLLPAYNGGAPKDCFPQAESAAKKALALDDNSADAHAALAAVKGLYHFDLTGSIAEYERALQLNPNDATAHHWLANEALAATGQTEREISEMKRALELDPLSLIINTNVGVAYFHARRFDEAIAQLRKTVEMDPGFYFVHYNLGQALELKGSIPDAIAEYQKAIALNDDPYPLGLLGHLYGTLGRKDEAQQILERLREARKQRYVQAYCLAAVYLGLGDRNEALNWLDESYRERDGFSLQSIRIDPVLVPLHGDPRFEALAEKIVPAREFTSAAPAPK
jgi:TolB-like protein/Tfp pilus assembly protein PilF